MQLLIQRCMLRTPEPKSDDITGFNSVFSCDYMGSAEFEFGALPAALRAITPRLKDYGIHEPRIEYQANSGERVFLFCIEAQVPTVSNILTDMFNQYNWAQQKNTKPSYTFKERTGFRETLDPTRSDEFSRNVVLWWDIENHWFAVLGKPTAKKLELALNRLAAKWAATAKAAGK